MKKDMTDLDRKEIHKLVDKILDENETKGTYQSIIAEVGIYPPNPAIQGVRYSKFCAEISIKTNETLLYGDE